LSPRKDRDQIFPQLVDGAVRHNNPVEIALEEATRLSEAGGQSRLPDIVVSIGSGKEQPDDRRDLGTRPPVASDTGIIVSRLRNLFTMIRYQIKINLDTDRRWNHVLSSRPELKERMKRINPDLGELPPPLDDTACVQRLRELIPQLTQAKTEINKRNPGVVKLVRDIACRLIASSFYFERDGNPVFGPGCSMTLPGCIKCRLDPVKEDMRNLAMYLSRSRQGASFLICGRPKVGDDVRFPLAMEPFLRNGIFNPLPVHVFVPGEETTTTIYLKMHGAEHDEQSYVISGFPRILLRQDFARQ